MWPILWTRSPSTVRVCRTSLAGTCWSNIAAETNRLIPLARSRKRSLIANKASLMKESLPPRQEKFCQEIVAGNTQSEAYRAAYNTKHMKTSTVHNKAYGLMQKGEIRARVEELRQPVVQAIQKSRIEWLQEIERCAFFDILEIVDQHGKKTGKTQNLKLSDRLDALELFGKATGFLKEKEQKGSPLEEFGAEVLLSMQKELQARIAARKALNGHAE